MKLKIALIILSIFLVPKVFAEDLTPINKMPIPEVAELNLCVTDDATKAPTMQRCDSNGYPKITLGTALSYSLDSIAVYPPQNSFTNITTNTNTQIISAAGYLFGITVNTAGSSNHTIKIYNNTACSGSVFGLFTTAAQTALMFGNGVYFSTGICATTSGTTPADITVIYK